MNIKNKIISILSSILVLCLILSGYKFYDKDKLGKNSNIESENKLVAEEVISEEIESLDEDSTTFKDGANAYELNIEGIMEQLTCDTYLSRKVGTEENIKAMKFIKNYFEAIGLQPFNNGNYYHDVRGMRGELLNQLGVPNNTDVKNVIGVIKGEDNKNAVVISAHFDHIILNNAQNTKLQGAVDNASGVSTLLESAKDLAEYYKNKKPAHDIIFAAFNAEELGLIGSMAFVQEFKDNYDKWYNINIDCIGIKDEGGLAVENNVERSQELYNDFIDVLDKNDVNYEMVPYAMNEDGRIVGTSDHAVFSKYDSASLIIGQCGISDVVHTTNDSMEIIDVELINEIKDVLVEFIIESDSKIY